MSTLDEIRERFMEVDRQAGLDQARRNDVTHGISGLGYTVHHERDTRAAQRPRYIMQEYVLPEEEAREQRDSQLAVLKAKIADLTSEHNDLAIRSLRVIATRQVEVMPGDVGYDEAPTRFSPRAYEGDVAWRDLAYSAADVSDAPSIVTHANIDSAYDNLVREGAATTGGVSPWMSLMPSTYPEDIGETVTAINYDR
jgi:hypothetical protein